MSDVFLAGARLPGHDGTCDILLADGRIRAIVPSGIVRAPVASRVLDVDGRYVIPGLWDNHVHFTQWALRSARHDFTEVTSPDELLMRLAGITGAAVSGVTAVSGAAAAPVIAFGVRDSLWSRPLSREQLDAVSNGQQIMLISADLHACWLSTTALDAFGIDPASHPTGHLREDDCFAFMRRLDDTPDDVSDALADQAGRTAAALGVVGIVDLEMRDNLAVWKRRIAAGQRSLRVSFGIYTPHLDAAIAAGLRTGDVIPSTEGLLTVGPFKVITDGSLNTRTAYCFEEYEGLEGLEHSRGLLTVAPDALLALLERATRAGLAPAVHAIGDHANHLALDAFEAVARAVQAEATATATGAAAGAARGRTLRGARIEHAQLLADADFERFAALGVTASVQPEHAMDDRDVADRYWAGRTDRAFAFERLRASGAALVLGSDAPVAPLDPWQTLAAAVGRARDGREPWHPEQRLSALAALAASTNGTGSISVGLPADVVVVDRDPLTTGPADLRSMPVAATFLAGRPTHLTLPG